MLLLVLTSYLFVQGHCLWACHNFLSLKAIPRFRPFSLVGPTQVFAFSKKSYEGNYTYLKTLSVYSAIQSMFCNLFSLFTFDFNHVLSFAGSACYYAEVLGLLLRDFSIFWAFFSFPIDRPTDPKSGNAFNGKQNKSKWMA